MRSNTPPPHAPRDELEVDSDDNLRWQKKYHPSTYGGNSIPLLDEERTYHAWEAFDFPFNAPSGPGALPNPFRREEMEAADAEQLKEKEKEPKRGKKRRRDWGDLDHHRFSRQQHTPPLSAKVAFTVDLANSSEEEDTSDDEAPTVGLKVVALKGAKEKRKRKKERRARGYISDSEDDDVLKNGGRRVPPRPK